MKRVKKCMVVLMSIIVMLSQGMSVRASDTELPPAGFEYMDIARAVREYELENRDSLAGIGISVFGEDETIYIDYIGYADREADVAVAEETVMEWGSVTKVLIWVSVMQLWEQGKLDLNTDVREYLPERFLTNLRYDEAVTMMHLMNHTAGFQETVPYLFVEKNEEIGTLEEELKRHRPTQIYEPGTVIAYSNWGTALAGYVVECISGESFYDYVHQHIFKPLGMEHSALAPDLSDNIWVKEKREELQCYTQEGTLIQESYYRMPLYPAGGCVSTLSDLELLGKALLDEKTPLFQEEETYQVFFTPTAYLENSDVPANYHGLWTEPFGMETIGHSGSTYGCSSYMVLDLENKIGAVVLNNQKGGDFDQMLTAIFGGISRQVYLKEGQSAPEGVFRPARTIRTGPFKLGGFSYMSDAHLTYRSWALVENNGDEKISCAYYDYLKVPDRQLILEIGCLLLWAVTVLFAFISLLFFPIKRLVCKKKGEKTLDKWRIWTAVLQLISGILVVVLMKLAFGFVWTDLYIGITVAFSVILVIITMLMIYGVAIIRKKNDLFIRRCYTGIVVASQSVVIVNIIYWNLFMWWKI